VARNARVGAFAFVDKGVVLHDDAVVMPHAVVTGSTSVGPRSRVFPFAVVGCRPQIRGWNGWNASLGVQIGADCIVREHCTINSGSSRPTVVGERSVLLAGTHIGHDCVLGEDVVVSNNCLLAGHVLVDHEAVIGGDCKIQQFVNVGRLAMVAGSSAVDRHVPPFTLVQGNRATIRNVNVVGLRRRKYSLDDVRLLRECIAIVLGNKGSEELTEPRHLTSEIAERLHRIPRFSSSAAVRIWLEFLLFEQTGLGSSVISWEGRRKKVGLCPLWSNCTKREVIG